MTVNGNGKRILVAKDFLNWIIPVLLTLLTAGVVMVYSRLGEIHDFQATMDARLIKIEASRFTTSDGLALWRELDGKVGRDEMATALSEIKLLLREKN